MQSRPVKTCILCENTHLYNMIPIFCTGFYGTSAEKPTTTRRFTRTQRSVNKADHITMAAAGQVLSLLTTAAIEERFRGDFHRIWHVRGGVSKSCIN